MRIVILVFLTLLLTACQPIQLEPVVTPASKAESAPTETSVPAAAHERSSKPAPKPSTPSDSPSEPDPQERIQELIDRADLAGRAGQLDEAESLLTDALELDPNDPVALYLRSTMRRMAGKVDEALADADRVLTLDLALGLTLRSEALYMAGDLEGALAAVDEAMAISVDTYRDMLPYRGQYLLLMGEFEQAIVAYDENLELANTPEERAMALYLLGGAFVQNGERERAREEFEQALDLGLPPDLADLVSDWLKTLD